MLLMAFYSAILLCFDVARQAAYIYCVINKHVYFTISLLAHLK